MAISDVESYAGRVSPGPFQHRRRPSSPISSTSLNEDHITDALAKSEDNGATLDFSHRGLTDVGEYGAEELAAIGREDHVEDESSVARISLANNRLATLPMAFALLSRLRYLNLKKNCLTVFPDVLTIMPCLEILEIGHNKIKRLPAQPGNLVNLRVLSLYKNKLTRLPSYISQFTQMYYLRVDQNPLEWPPKSVTDSTGKDMQNWIKGLQAWIEDNTSNPPGSRKLSEDSIMSERNVPARLRDEPAKLPTIPPDPDNSFESGPTPHARTFSTVSDASLYSFVEGLVSGSGAHGPAGSPSSRPPPLQLDQLVASVSAEMSPSHSPDSYLPTPEESVSSTDDELTMQPPDLSTFHARNASYAGATRGTHRSGLHGKKSLPDLRPAKLRLGVDTGSEGLFSVSPGGHTAYTGPLKINKSIDQFTIPSPISQRQGSDESSDGAPLPSRTARPFAQGPISASPTAMDRPAPSMDVERNSYFRRFSTLPPSTISKTIPDSLLKLVDAVRGILFAVSQVYETLQHYTVYAIDERLSSVLLKVLDPASNYITQLITALDRFDSMSRRTIPTPTVCRAVIESCKDNVAAFGKAVAVLSVQLKVLATRDDVRYTRQMLLVLYGATAEISNAWQSMTPHIATVEPLLRDHRRIPVTKRSASTTLTPPTPGAADIPSSAPPRAAMFTPPKLPHNPPSTPGPDGTGRTHQARRHAGSFSAEDVNIGRTLPIVDAPHLQAGLAMGSPEVPTPRAALRQAGYFVPLTGNMASISISTPSKSAFQANMKPLMTSNSHSRQGSQSSQFDSSASSSPSLTNRMPTLDVPSNNMNVIVDKEAVDAMTKAIEAAPPVWNMLNSILVDVSDRREEVRETLGRAQVITQRLKEGLSGIQTVATEQARKSVHNDARTFVKTIVQLSHLIKSYGNSHPLSSALRSHMVKLTNATEEFVILLHVSSFSTPTTPRPYSPMVQSSPSISQGPSQSGYLGAEFHAPSDSRFPPSLSRSRSAQATATKLVSPNLITLSLCSLNSSFALLPSPFSPSPPAVVQKHRSHRPAIPAAQPCCSSTDLAPDAAIVPCSPETRAWP